jgi:hypothetical protein
MQQLQQCMIYTPQTPTWFELWSGGQQINPKPHHPVISIVRRVRENALSKDFDRAHSPSWCCFRWGFNDRLDKISAREKSSSKDDNSGCLSNAIGCACLTVRAPPSCRANSGTKAAAVIFASARRSFLLPLPHFLFYLPVMTPPTKHARPPDEDGEEDLERPVHRQRTSASDVNAVPVDGPVVVLSDQVKERGRHRDSWNRVKRRLRSAFDLLQALFFVQVRNEHVCLRLRGFIQPRVR